MLKIRERGNFTIVDYVERLMKKEIHQCQLAQRVSDFDEKKHIARLVQIVPWQLS